MLTLYRYHLALIEVVHSCDCIYFQPSVVVSQPPHQVSSRFVASCRALIRQDDCDISRRPRLPVPGTKQEEADRGADDAVRRQEELLDPGPEGRLHQGGDCQHQG